MVQLSMVGLMVRDMAASLEFYRRLGLDIPAGSEAKEFVEVRMESGVTIFFDTVFADTYDPHRKRPSGGYQMMLEFFLEDNDAVVSKYEALTGFGYRGRLEPVQTFGPYAAMVEDPDGNVVLLTAG
ncbi:MAG: VOC family protein [Chloroflexota bacterium]|nr:VOC family protein [Chloroflexota bacterium]MDQ3690059.1 VOC family protein [Chloroflexota bacterium]